jgi:hypothetical protein
VADYRGSVRSPRLKVIVDLGEAWKLAEKKADGAQGGDGHCLCRTNAVWEHGA